VSVCLVCGSLLKPRDTNCPVCGASHSAFAASALPALDPIYLPPNTQLLGQYTLLEVLGQGGFGITYRAQKGKRDVAIKEFFPDGSMRIAGAVQAPNGMGSDEFETLQQKFLEEHSVLKRFMQGSNHPNIVDVFETFAANGTSYLVMELLRGETLESHIVKQGQVKAKQMRHIAKQLCAALTTIHQAGLLHRDIKPANVFLEQGGRTVLIDFGSARGFQSGKTQRHTRMISAGYAPLEQYSSQARVDASTDVYGLAATLYHAITGNIPPSATDRMNGASLAPLSSRLGSGLRQAIEQGLSLQMADRPRNAQAFAALIDKNTPVVQPKAPAKAVRPQASSSDTTHNNDFLAFLAFGTIIFFLSLVLESLKLEWLEAWTVGVFRVGLVFGVAWVYTTTLEFMLSFFVKKTPVSLLRRVWLMGWGIFVGFLVQVVLQIFDEYNLGFGLVLSAVVSGFLLVRAYRFPSPAQTWQAANWWDGLWLVLIAGLLEWTGAWGLLF
jgi:serine/threonine protein kinase